MKKLFRKSLIFITSLALLFTCIPIQQVHATEQVTGANSGHSGGGGGHVSTASGAWSGDWQGYRFYVVDSQFNCVSEVLDYVLKPPIGVTEFITSTRGQALNISGSPGKIGTFQKLKEQSGASQDPPKPSLSVISGAVQGEAFRRWFLGGEGGGNVLTYEPGGSGTGAWSPSGGGSFSGGSSFGGGSFGGNIGNYAPDTIPPNPTSVSSQHGACYCNLLASYMQYYETYKNFKLQHNYMGTESDIAKAVTIVNKIQLDLQLGMTANYLDNSKCNSSVPNFSTVNATLGAGIKSILTYYSSPVNDFALALLVGGYTEDELRNYLVTPTSSSTDPNIHDSTNRKSPNGATYRDPFQHFKKKDGQSRNQTDNSLELAAQYGSNILSDGTQIFDLDKLPLTESGYGTTGTPAHTFTGDKSLWNIPGYSSALRALEDINTAGGFIQRKYFLVVEPITWLPIADRYGDVVRSGMVYGTIANLAQYYHENWNRLGTGYYKSVFNTFFNSMTVGETYMDLTMQGSIIQPANSKIGFLATGEYTSMVRAGGGWGMHIYTSLEGSPGTSTCDEPVAPGGPHPAPNDNPDNTPGGGRNTKPDGTPYPNVNIVKLA